jgi:hypothetical protein
MPVPLEQLVASLRQRGLPQPVIDAVISIDDTWASGAFDITTGRHDAAGRTGAAEAHRGRAALPRLNRPRHAQHSVTIDEIFLRDFSRVAALSGMNTENKVPNLTPWSTYVYAALFVALVVAGFLFMNGTFEISINL